MITMPYDKANFYTQKDIYPYAYVAKIKCANGDIKSKSWPHLATF